MRFAVLLALVATTSAVQINIASLKESTIDEVATPASSGKLEVNKTRIKELADAEIAHHVKQEELTSETGLNKTRIDALTLQNLKDTPIKLDHSKVNKDASKIKEKKENDFRQEERHNKSRLAAAKLAYDADMATKDNTYPRGKIQSVSSELKKTTKD